MIIYLMKYLLKTEIKNFIDDISNDIKFRFKENVKEYGITNIEEFSKVIKTTGSIIAGGFVTNCVLPFLNSDNKNEPNDIDIFM